MVDRETEQNSMKSDCQCGQPKAMCVAEGCRCPDYRAAVVA